MSGSICAHPAAGEPKNEPTTTAPAPEDKTPANQCNSYEPAPEPSEREDSDKNYGPLLPDPGPVGSGPGGPSPTPEKPEDNDSEIDTSGVDLEPILSETDEPDKAFTTPGAEETCAVVWEHVQGEVTFWAAEWVDYYRSDLRRS